MNQMNSEAKATPRLNWIVAKKLIHLDLHEGEENAPIVTVLGSVTKDKLEAIERIGRAVNNHEQLLEACREALATLEQAITKLQMNGEWASPEGIGKHHTLNNLRQAIANATK